MKKKYTINDLPKFSPWPSHLLGLDKWNQRHKSAREVKREYKEKWSSLLIRAGKSKVDITVETVDSWHRSRNRSLVLNKGKLTLSSQLKIHRQYIDLIEATLKNYLPASSLIELGCGYGSIILALKKRKNFKNMEAIASEYTKSGIKLLDILAASQKTKILTGFCDFRSTGITRLKVPQHSLIFTSYATHYVPQLSTRFVKDLSSFKPRAIIHFEPCYEHHDESTLLSMMQRRYIEINDYNQNLVSLLKKQEQSGMIKIISEQKSVFGHNPLLPISIVAWRPTG